MYGPSGCGKSSLVKAGLLPRLGDRVISLYVEATPADTEIRLLKGLQKRVPSAQADQSLPDVLEMLRERGIGDGRKVLLVLDQFEQWLHAHGDEPNSQLLHALRQCDGGRVHVGYWYAKSMRCPACASSLNWTSIWARARTSGSLTCSTNVTARRCCDSSGRPMRCCRRLMPDISSEQCDFLRQAAQQLADDKGRICVRLALFADMFQSKPWTLSTLAKVGGTLGVGITFLDENLSAEHASPTRRHLLQAARDVLRQLLPDAGSGDIKGAMRSHEELLNSPPTRIDLLNSAASFGC